MQKKNEGITLVELLVVISSIAILLTVSVSALSRSRTQAKSAVCVSNLNQLGMCFDLYTTDSRGSFWDGVNWSSTDLMWMDVLRPYYADTNKVLCCPVTPEPTPTELNYGRFGTSKTTWVYPRPAPMKSDYGSYAVNGWISDPKVYPSTWGDPANLWRNSNQSGKSNIPVFADGLWFHVIPLSTDRPSTYSDRMSNPLCSMQRVCSDRHGGTTNVSFMDGSVRSIGLKQLWKLKWHRNYDINVREPVWPTWMNNLDLD